jgi:hypothetical protein
MLMGHHPQQEFPEIDHTAVKVRLAEPHFPDRAPAR